MITKAQHATIAAAAKELTDALDRLLEAIQDDDVERALEDLEDVDHAARAVASQATIVLVHEAAAAGIDVDAVRSNYRA